MHCFYLFILYVFRLLAAQVLKVDGAYVAVKFPGTSSSVSSQATAVAADSDPSSLLQDCRLLRIDELQVGPQPPSRNRALNVSFLVILSCVCVVYFWEKLSPFNSCFGFQSSFSNPSCFCVPIGG